VKRFVAAAAAAALICSSGCGSAARRAPRGRVRVAAASDLNAAMPDLVARFGASHDVDVDVSYGSSGTFYAQLLNQAPFDLFFSADVEYPHQLATRGLTLEGGEFQYAVGRLVLWVPRSSSVDVTGLKGLASSRVAHITIANPDHAPYGRAAVAALQSAGVYEAVRPRLVFGENVAQAMQFVQSGAADAGIVALSLALAPAARDAGRYVEIPLDQYPRIDQGGTILKWAADVDAAHALRAYVLSADGRAVLRQYGFFLPDQ
jgi:molybdate transport system substrate-binding protein